MIRLTRVPEDLIPIRVDSFEYWVRKELPPRYAEAALVNRRKVEKNRVDLQVVSFKNAAGAIGGGFLWGDESNESFSFWSQVYSHLKDRGKPLPPFEGDLI